MTGPDDQMLCRRCGVPIAWLESIQQWWHITGFNGTHAYRGCRDKSGKLTGRGCAKPEVIVA